MLPDREGLCEVTAGGCDFSCGAGRNFIYWKERTASAGKQGLRLRWRIPMTGVVTVCVIPGVLAGMFCFYLWLCFPPAAAGESG